MVTGTVEGKARIPAQVRDLISMYAEFTVLPHSPRQHNQVTVGLKNTQARS